MSARDEEPEVVVGQDPATALAVELGLADVEEGLDVLVADLREMRVDLGDPCTAEGRETRTQEFHVVEGAEARLLQGHGRCESLDGKGLGRWCKHLGRRRGWGYRRRW